MLMPQYGQRGEESGSFAGRQSSAVEVSALWQFWQGVCQRYHATAAKLNSPTSLINPFDKALWGALACQMTSTIMNAMK